MLRKTLSFIGVTGLYLAFATLVCNLFGEAGILLAIPIGPINLSDPGIRKIWRELSQDAYWAAVYKSAFSSPQFTGTNKSRRKINTREDIYGPPFVEYFDLRKASGDTLTDTIHIPPFLGDEEVLFGDADHKGYVRVKGQNRVGFEIQAGRKNIKFALQSYFMSAYEDDVRMSEQELGGDLLELLLEHLSDLGGRYQDADKAITIFQGWSPHIYARIAQSDSTIEDNDPAPASASMGVEPPLEHPNTYAWINKGSSADPDYKLIAANDIPDATTTDGANASNWTGKVHEAVGLVDSTALPGRKMLDAIVYATTQLRMVPIRYRTDGQLNAYYLVLMSPSMMNLFYDDPDFEKRMDSAFMGAMYKHPLINEDDKIYRCLILRQIEKFDQKLYTYHYSFGGDYDSADADKGGNASRTGLETGQEATTVKVRKDNTSGTGRNLRTYLNYTPRTFRRYIDDTDTNVGLAADGASEASGQPAGNDDAIGPDGGSKIDRVVVLGASALGIVPGHVFELDRRKEDDYGNILGVGQEFHGGNRRIEWGTQYGHKSGQDNQTSMIVAAYNGK